MGYFTKWEHDLDDLLRSPGNRFLELARYVSVTTTQDFSFVSSRANGPFIWDTKGKRYFDFSSAVGSMNLGHNVTEVNEAVLRQMKRLDQLSDQDWPNDTATLLKRKLTEIVPGVFPKKVFFGNSGTEAIEAAIKLLLANRPERTQFIAFEKAFHGRTGYSLALHGGKPVNREHFPKTLEVHRLPFPEVGKYADTADWWKEASKVLDHVNLDLVNGIFIELVQGEGGINVADSRIVEQIAKSFAGWGINVVVDEIQTGFGRTGKILACDHYRIEPDIVCLGKSLGGGLPIGATVARADLDFDRSGRHSNTFGGSPIVAAAALTTIELLESLDENLLHRNESVLKEFAPEGLGFMRRWRFPSPDVRNSFVKDAEARGVLLLGAGNANVRFMPPLNTKTELLEEALQILRLINIPHL